MIYTRILVACLTFLALLTPSTFGQTTPPAGENGNKAVLDRLDKMDRGLNVIVKKISEDIKILQDNHENMKTNITTMMGDGLKVKTDLGTTVMKLKDLEDQLAALRSALTQLQSGKTGYERSYLDPRSSNWGRINLVNNYNEDLTFVVNQRS